MSAAERAPAVHAPRSDPPPPPRGRERTLSGWGRVARSRAHVLAIEDAEQVPGALTAVAAAGGAAIARGAGRSYGDAAQLAGGTVLDMTALDSILSIDPENLLARVQPGVTYERLLPELAARGLIFAVVPGTRYVTVGGAIASDIHGKSHEVDGSMAAHVASLRLCMPAGGVREISAESDPDLFHATLGGMGLTGVIVEATLRVQRLASPWWSVDTLRTSSLEHTISLMAQDDGHRYSVTWLDLLARGQAIGRGIVMASNDWGTPPPPPRRGQGANDPASLPPPRLRTPRGWPGAILSPPFVTAFNAMRWRLSGRDRRAVATPLATHYFQLDQVREWNRLYGTHGFVQYQFVVPPQAVSAVVDAVELLRVRRLPAYLAVLKRLGPASGGLLSFPIEGWTLALDLPAAATGLRPALDELDELVASNGGRVYLTKDVRLRRDLFAAMYPLLGQFRKQRAFADPAGVLRSDLGRRLGLCGALGG